MLTEKVSIIAGGETSYAGPPTQALGVPYGSYPMSPIIASRLLLLKRIRNLLASEVRVVTEFTRA